MTNKLREPRVRGGSVGQRMYAWLAGESPIGINRNREWIDSASPPTTTRQKFTWPSGQGPTAIDIRAYSSTGYGTLANEGIAVTFDSESDAVADANLAQTGGEAVDIQNEIILCTDKWVRKYFSTPLERMDFIIDTATVTAVRVRAV